MAAPEWTYSDWITYESGTATRLTRLRLHIKEVSDRISTGNYSNQKGSHDKDALEKYLELLHRDERSESAAAGATNGSRAYFTRGRAI